ncbi:hypothetical protein [Levilactobacillus brevis]|uniref:hypothetical protein n=1 Tax=Levilactobacillus brevis TaxID=1580 RepID=UPI001BAD7245|nr:hypothetical protein [Levilactobacillus brevis]MBS0978706.1 hypothetical protein [Levilactobacillus brevis]
MLALIHFFIKNLIALLSFAISIYTLWKNRKSLLVEWEKNIYESDIGSVFSMKNDSNIDTNSINGTYEYPYVTNISVVNPSPNDIGFFDLRAFNTKTNIDLPLVTCKTFEVGHDSDKIYQIIGNQYAELDIPDRKYGVFKANSFTRFDLVVILPTDKNIDLDHIVISLKVTKRGLFKDPFALSKRKKFKYYGMNYNVSGWKERRIQQEQVQQAESVSQNRNK